MIVSRMPLFTISRFFMPSDHDLILKQPISVLNTSVEINFKSFFVNLTKATIASGFGDYKGGLEYSVDALKEAGLTDSPESMAWILISKSLAQAVSTLVEDYQDLLTAKLDEDSITDLADRVDYQLNMVEVGIDASFFENPQNLPLLDDFKSTLSYWLKKLGMDVYQINSFHSRLKGQFVLSLHEEWGNHSDDYRCLTDQIDTPFTKASLKQRSWKKYNAWLQEQANERVFGEAFGLNQVYIRLRAYYEEKAKDLKDNEAHKRNRKVVCDLHSEIEHWIAHFDDRDSLRVISGGPGSGKSSFAKMLAAELVKKQTVAVLFIPLHHFNPNDDLITAVANFVRVDPYLRVNPLDPQDGQKRLLLIFDGLDELSMQGKAADEVAQQFVDEVIRTLDRYNNGSIKWQALITGRELSVQANTSRLRKSQQVLHALPYHLSEHETTFYEDKNNLLQTDQRDDWWRLFGKNKGKGYESLPKELRIDHLQPITREPLLNYLVALSYEGGKITFDDNISLNQIYYDLLKRVHERQYEGHRHSGSKHLEFKDFLRVLEEIALAVWHGNGRTASTSYLVARCKESRLEQHLEGFSNDAKSGVVRLLTAFYFREFGQDDSGDKTFEFTHKSFGEYLTARRIIKQLKLTSDEIERNKENGDGGWSPDEALVKWIKICGPTAIDSYLFRFIKDEVALLEKDAGLEIITKWQRTFLDLLSQVVRKHSPMEKSALGTFSEMLRQSRNAEESLLVLHSACALNTKAVLDVNWGGNVNFGTWLKRIQEQRSGGENTMALTSMNFMNYDNQFFYIADLFGAKLSKTSFQRAKFGLANLSFANLSEANLSEADISGALLPKANLSGANLTKADLTGASLTFANLTGADLTGVNLSGADLTEACLKGVNLINAKLDGTNFEGANLEGANLKGTKLKNANNNQTSLDKIRKKGKR